MKKIILAISILTLFSFALVPFAIDAAIIPAGSGGAGSSDGIEAPDVELTLWGEKSILTKAINWLFGLVIFVAAIMLIWAGFTYVTSAGNAEKMKTALNSVIYALIGIAIAILAKGFVYMICQFVGGTECKFF